MTDLNIECDLEDRLGQVVDDFFEAVAQGDKPDISDYVRRYPDLADLLKVVLPAMLATEQASAPTRAAGLEDSLSEERRLGDFRILRQLGRGGMGIVYEAEQVSMQRRVALKVLPLAGLVDELKIHRFQNEVRAVAALNHPNIVPVYTVGQERGVHYYAMQLIHGRSLSDVIESLRRCRSDGAPIDGTSISQATGMRRGWQEAEGLESAAKNALGDSVCHSQLPIQDTIVSADSTIPHSSQREYYRTVATLGIQAAMALQHAHEQGIVHRDIKPANLLLDSSAKLYVTDFGLARIESDAGVTMTSDLVGTLRYMAPEQALGKRVVVDHRADIYSLGVTLYELLTLRPAYQAEDRRQLLKQIAFEDPTMLRRVDPSIPRDLETIVHKAMSKDMDHRYSSAQEVADDLRSHLENRPIAATPPSTSEIILKWTRRNPAATWATIITLTLTTISLGTSTLLYSRQLKRTSSAEQKATVTSQQLTKRTSELERHGYLLHLSNADSAFLQERYVLAQAELDACPRLQRGWEWDYHAERIRDVFPFSARAGGAKLTRDRMRLFAITPRPDGQYAQVTSWDLKSGLVIQEIDCGVPLDCLAVSSDGQWIAFSYSGQVVVLQTETKREVWHIAMSGLDRADIGNKYLALSPDDRLLAFVSVDDRQIIILDATNGDERCRSVEFGGDVPSEPKFSPNSRWLACEGEEAARIIDVETGNVVAKTSQAGGTLKPTFDPTGTRVATGSRDGWIHIWDWDNKRLEKSVSWRASSQSLHGMAFNADGTRLVAGFRGGTVSVWNVASQERLAELKTLGPLYRPRFCPSCDDFSADDRILMESPTVGTSLWAWKSIEREIRPQPLGGAVEVTFSPDGRFVLAATPMYFTGGSIYYHSKPYYVSEPAAILDAESGATVAKINEPVYAASWSPDGTEIVATPATGDAIRTFDAKTGASSSRQFAGHTGTFTISVVSAQSGQLVSFSSDKTIRMFEFDSGTLVLMHRLNIPANLGSPKYPGTNAALSPDGSLLELSGEIRDTRSGANVSRGYMDNLSGHWPKRAVFANDNATMFVGGYGGLLVQVDIATSRLKTRFVGNLGAVVGVALSPDEQHVVSGDSTGQVIVWDVPSGRSVITLIESGPEISSLDWSSDGHHIAAGKVDGTVQIWTLPTGAR